MLNHPSWGLLGYSEGIGAMEQDALVEAILATEKVK